MADASLLTYCLNVHPSETLAEVLTALNRWAGPIGAELAGSSPFPLGLRLGDRAVSDLISSPGALEELLEALSRNHLSVLTLNAFPMRAFHGAEVKATVYEPNWCTEERVRYTVDCARLALRLPRSHPEVLTISTLPLGFDLGHTQCLDQELAAHNLLRVAHSLHLLREESGIRVLLCLEPEPLCVLSETKDLHAFFKKVLLPMAKAQGLRGGYDGEARCLAHLGACFDVCHAAVLFEDIPDSIRMLWRDGVSIGKVQVSSALSATHWVPQDPRLSALDRFAEPRYLHQTVTLCPEGNRRSYLDLNEFLEDMRQDPRPLGEVRSHFHVPIDQAKMGLLGTTQSCILQALGALRGAPPIPLEIETYTRSVIPDSSGDADVVPGVLREIRWAKDVIDSVLGRP